MEENNNENKVQEVLDIYLPLHIREKVQQTVADEFTQARQCLAEINIDDKQKAPFYELMDILFDRKK